MIPCTYVYIDLMYHGKKEILFVIYITYFILQLTLRNRVPVKKLCRSASQTSTFMEQEYLLFKGSSH
jgi:hypothetical protein